MFGRRKSCMELWLRIVVMIGFTFVWGVVTYRHYRWKLNKRVEEFCREDSEFWYRLVSFIIAGGLCVWFLFRET